MVNYTSGLLHAFLLLIPELDSFSKSDNDLSKSPFFYMASNCSINLCISKNAQKILMQYFFFLVSLHKNCKCTCNSFTHFHQNHNLNYLKISC